MMNKYVSEAAEILEIDLEEAKKNSKRLEDIDATYFWDSRKGGRAVIFSDEGERLVAASCISSEQHIQEFRGGRRS